MKKIRILTTQNVAVEYQLALAGERIIANIIDYFIKGGYALSIVVIASFAEFALGKSKELILGFIILIPFLLYNVLMEVFMGGQTVGMRLRKIKVIRLDGKELGIGNCILRWLFRIVDVTISGGSVAIITIAATEKGQRLGDLAAGTTVVKIAKAEGLNSTILAHTPENYQVQFPSAHLLTDQNINLIKEILIRYKQTNNYRIVVEMANKVKDNLKIETNMAAPQFLETIILDYNHLTGN